MKQWYVAVDEPDTLRIHYRIWRRNGRMTEFLISLRYSALGTWKEAAYIDCKHGHIHVHVLVGDREDTRSLRRLDSLEDVDAGYADASAKMDAVAVMMRDQLEEDDE